MNTAIVLLAVTSFEYPAPAKEMKRRRIALERWQRANGVALTLPLRDKTVAQHLAAIAAEDLRFKVEAHEIVLTLDP